MWLISYIFNSREGGVNLTTKVKHILSTAILLILIITSINKISNLLQSKESDIIYSSFLDKGSNVDVVILGSSHVKYGIFATELWNYGISAYNLATDGATIPTCYWTLVNALDYQKPQIVVLDVFDMWPGRICSVHWGQVHIQFDFFPLSINKYRMVEDLFSDKELTGYNDDNLYEKRWELLWKLGEYHTRWNDLNEDDFSEKSEIKKISAVWKGSSPLIGIVDRSEKIYTDNWADIEYDNLSKEYLIKIIELCNEKDIELLLTNTGYDCDAGSKLFADSVNDIALQYGKTFLDFTQMDIINFKTDLYDSGHNTHVNFSGAEKFTKYIGDYLSNNYTLTDHRDDESYSQWWEDYQEFVSSKADYLKKQTDIAYYLMFLSDDDYKTVIEVKDSSILSEGRNQAMMENLGVDFDDMGDCNLLTIDNGTNNVSYIENSYDDKSVMETNLGELEILYSDDLSVYGLYLDGKEIYEKELTEDNERMRITVISKSTGEVIDVKTF
jgi:hypothetical protein